MPRLRLSGWNVAPQTRFQAKVDAMQPLMRATDYGLKEAKACLDKVFEGGESSVEVRDSTQAEDLAAQLRGLGAVVHIEASGRDGEPFDVHRPLFDGDTGDFDEEGADRYRDELIERFNASPEAQALEENCDWVDPFLAFGIDYLGVTPEEMTPADVREILFGLFPQKVSASPSESPQIVAELRAFWHFLHREYGLKNADACLKALDDRAVKKLEREMGDPANYGMAKAMMMRGIERGFDVGTPEGIEKWMQTYNAELESGIGEPLPLPRAPLPRFDFPSSNMSKASREREKNKRKMQEASRKRNRKK